MEELPCQMMAGTTHDGIPIVDDVTVESMWGDTLLEKELNAYLTRQFILSKDMPADECLSEARHIIELVKKHMGP